MSARLGDDDKKRVEEAIRAAEARTRLEIVLATAPRSAGYARWLWPPALLATLALALVVHLAVPTIPAFWLLAGQLPVVVALFRLFNWAPLALRLVPDEVEIDAVKREAMRLFAEHALFETTARAGVLLYVSELERRVEILADRGLDSLVDEAGWKTHVTHVVEAIKGGRAAAGLCEVIAAIAAQAAPLGTEAQPKNELPELV